MKLFVWDLHGTLEEGNENAVIDISNEVLARYGYAERFRYEDGKHLYGARWFEYFTWLLPDDSPKERALDLQEACFELSESNPELQYRWLKPTPHSHDVLSAISVEHDQILVSNTRTANLEVFLKILAIDRFFPRGKAWAADQPNGKAPLRKPDLLKQYLDSSGSTYEDTVIIGDSPSDMKLKEVSGGTTFLYSHPGFAFRECAADFKIRDLREVLKVS